MPNGYNLSKMCNLLPSCKWKFMILQPTIIGLKLTCSSSISWLQSSTQRSQQPSRNQNASILEITDLENGLAHGPPRFKIQAYTNNLRDGKSTDYHLFNNTTSNFAALGAYPLQHSWFHQIHNNHNSYIKIRLIQHPLIVHSSIHRWSVANFSNYTPCK